MKVDGVGEWSLLVEDGDKMKGEKMDELHEITGSGPGIYVIWWRL